MVARKRSVSHLARLNPGVRRTLFIGLVSAGCSNPRVVLGWNATEAGAPQGTDAGDAGPPSCQASGAGLTNCGGSSESCCASLQVPGGTYYRTYTPSGGSPTNEADPASVNAFRLDKYLVTVGRFRQFVTAWNGGAGWVERDGGRLRAGLGGVGRR
jgi:hypothetical protein